MAGRPEETSDEDILDIFRQLDDLVLSTAEVAKKLSYSQPGAYKRLRNLEEEGVWSPRCWAMSELSGYLRQNGSYYHQ